MLWTKSHTGLAMAIVCLPVGASAQLDRFEFAVMAGLHVYQGDLTPSFMGSYRTAGWQGGAYIGYKWKPGILLRLNLSTGSLHGDDSRYDSPAYRQQRNFRFNGKLRELSLLAQYSPDTRFRLQPYLFGGVGLGSFSIARDASRFNAEYFAAESSTLTGLAEDTTHALARLQPIVPIGAGLRYPLTERWSLFAETSYQLVFTDYLDGFSKSANPSKDDKYLRHSVGVIYTPSFRKGLDCPRSVY